MIALEKVINCMGNGATNPHLVVCSDGKKYVAKFPGNPDGTRVLINEYVCSSIARKLMLPIPRFELADASNIGKHTDFLTGVDLIPGTAFCSEYLEKVTIANSYDIIFHTSNKNDAIKILIFDIIINNNDRNPGNLLVDLKNQSLIMIDHSHVFEYEALWTAGNLDSLKNQPICVKKMNQGSLNNLWQIVNSNDYNLEIIEFSRKVSELKKEYFEELVNSIPADWQITNEEKKSLVEYLKAKFDRFLEICEFLGIKMKGGD